MKEIDYLVEYFKRSSLHCNTKSKIQGDGIVLTCNNGTDIEVHPGQEYTTIRIVAENITAVVRRDEESKEAKLVIPGFKECTSAYVKNITDSIFGLPDVSGQGFNNYSIVGITKYIDELSKLRWPNGKPVVLKAPNHWGDFMKNGSIEISKISENKYLLWKGTGASIVLTTRGIFMVRNYGVGFTGCYPDQENLLSTLFVLPLDVFPNNVSRDSVDFLFGDKKLSVMIRPVMNHPFIENYAAAKTMFFLKDLLIEYGVV